MERTYNKESGRNLLARLGFLDLDISHDSLRRALSRKISFRSRCVIEDLYGIYGPQYSVQELAKIQRVTPKRIKSVELKGIEELQSLMYK